MEIEVPKKYNVIIESVGTAKPSVSKILAEGLSLPIEFITQTIYKAPALLFREVDSNLAESSKMLLTQLGLEVSIDETTQVRDFQHEQVEVCVYVDNIAKLPEINQQVADFLGCETKTALSLLMNEPAIVLGGVTVATAEALSKRVDAEVIISNPKTDLYTIEIIKSDHIHIAQIKDFIKQYQLNLVDTKFIVDVSYDQAQNIWKRFQSNHVLKIINQSFRRFEIVLESIDSQQPNVKKSLIELTGMPEEIVEEVIQELPIQLEESVSYAAVAEKLKMYKNVGLNCEAYSIPFNLCNVVIEQLNYSAQINEILSNYFDKNTLPNSASTKWKSNIPINQLLARFIAYQLQLINCEVNIEIV